MMPNDFEYYLKKNILKKISPDILRASFLTSEAQNSFEGLKERIEVMGINDKNSNSIIKDSYDIIMELVRAKLLIDGFSSSGQYSHEAEVAYLKEIGFPETQVSTLNEIRYHRNSVTYYGKILDKSYTQKVYNFLVEVYPVLTKKLKAVIASENEVAKKQ